MLGIIILFLVGIIFVNFLGRQWYSMDIYTDSYIARLMSESNSIFPDGWIFGNQYYGFATPVIAAMFYKIIPNSFYAMATASTFMTFLIIVSFIWCFKRFCTKNEIIVGLFGIICLILGNQAATSQQGMQLFYTMASFYSCYLIGVFITLGCYLRLYFENSRLHIGFWILVFIVNYLLGINSPRELLVLSLPLFAIEILRAIVKIAKKSDISRKTLLFSGMTVLSEILGLLTVKAIKPLSHKIIAPVRFPDSLETLANNFHSTLKAILQITGLDFGLRGLKWLPLFAAAVFLISIVVWSIIRIIKTKEVSAVAVSIFYCCVSLAAVAFVGVVLMPVRQIYFFVWYLLVSLCAIYFYKYQNQIEQKEKVKKAFCKSVLILLCLVAIGNFFFNFFFCFYHYSEVNNIYKAAAQRLESDKIDCVYVFPTTSPTIAIYTKDTVVAGTVEINKEWSLESDEKILKPIDYLTKSQMYQSDKDIYLVSSNWDEAYLDKFLNADEKKFFYDQIEFVTTYNCSGFELTLYQVPKQFLDLSSLQFTE